MGFFNTPTVLPQIKAGKLKALAVTSGHRSPLLEAGPHGRTFSASGAPYEAAFDVTCW